MYGVVILMQGGVKLYILYIGAGFLFGSSLGSLELALDHVSSRTLVKRLELLMYLTDR